MTQNDKKIFEYLKPMNNDMLSKVSYKDLEEILMYINKYYLEYRDSLGLDDAANFGIEIEFEHFDGWSGLKFSQFNDEIVNIVGNKYWDTRNDISLNQGREVVSDILADNFNNWDKIRKVCEFSLTRGRIDVNCAAHVHAGSHILGDNVRYWYRFFKLWSMYENVIYRFCYGEYLTQRPNIINYARPASGFYNDRLKRVEGNLDCSLLEMLRRIEPMGLTERYTKNFGVSYWRMLLDNDYEEYEDYNVLNDGCTLELRAPNGTLDEIIWQNLINFFIKMLLYCKSDRFNDEILERNFNYISFSDYSKIYIEQAIEFTDMIFDNNLDKVYFLRQYLKSMEVSDKPFVKAKKMTMTNR